jgi:hypothetical protein
MTPSHSFRFCFAAFVLVVPLLGLSPLTAQADEAADKSAAVRAKMQSFVFTCC